MTPFRYYICDTCKEVINDTKLGVVEWLVREDEKIGYVSYGYRIVHEHNHDIRPCQKYLGDKYEDMESTSLDDFLDEDTKMARLLSIIDAGPFRKHSFVGPEVDNLREYAEFMRRLTIPYYEEARQFWDKAQEDGYLDEHNDIDTYAIHNLKAVVERYTK